MASEDFLSLPAVPPPPFILRPKRRRDDTREGMGGGAFPWGTGVTVAPTPPPPASAIPWRAGRALAGELAALHASSGGAAPVRAAFWSPPSRSPLLRLHEEVLDFCALMSPTPSEVAIAARALGTVHAALLVLFPDSRAEVFGSRANGLVLPTSDWDVVLFGVRGTRPNMQRIASDLTSKGLVRKTEVIDSARVPIVKVWEASSNICIDISFEAASASGLATRAVITDLLTRYPPVRPLVIVLKYFLLQRGLNDTYSGGLGSYLLVLMVTAAVQSQIRAAAASAATAAVVSERGGGGGGGGGDVGGPMRRGLLGSAAGGGGGGGGPFRSARDGPLTTTISACGAGGGGGAPPPPAAAAATSLPSRGLGMLPGGSVHAPHLNLGALLVSFFELFGANLNHTAVGISVRGTCGGFYLKRAQGWADPARPWALSIESPVDPTQDVGRNSWAFQKVRRALSHAHSALARGIRAWVAAGGATPSAGADGGGSATAFPPPPPASLLANVIRVDTLLRDRCGELEAQRDEAKAALAGRGAGGGAGGEALEDDTGGAIRMEGEEEGGEGAGAGVGAGARHSGIAPPAPSPVLHHLEQQLLKRQRAASGNAGSSAGATPIVSGGGGVVWNPPTHLLSADGGAVGVGAGAGAGAQGVVVGAGGAPAPDAFEAVKQAAMDHLDGLASAGGARGGRGEGGGGGAGGDAALIVLRHRRLLADILTRKARGVPAIAPLELAPGGGAWY